MRGHHSWTNCVPNHHRTHNSQLVWAQQKTGDRVGEQQLERSCELLTTELYEHISELTRPFSTQAWNGAMYESTRSCTPLAALSNLGKPGPACSCADIMCRRLYAPAL
jgi:hypothetical protein